MTSPDVSVFLWLNGLVGKSPFFDRVMSIAANDFLIPILMSVVMVVLWWGTADRQKREHHQKAVMCACMGLGLSSLWVKLINWWIHLWLRPYHAGHQVNMLFYPSRDPSFPSNSSAVVFAIATGIFMANRKVGAFFYFLAVVLAFARVYDGVHYPLDVIGGAAIGIVTSLVVSKLFRWSEPFPSWLLWLGKRLYLA